MFSICSLDVSMAAATGSTQKAVTADAAVPKSLVRDNSAHAASNFAKATQRFA